MKRFALTLALLFVAACDSPDLVAPPAPDAWYTGAPVQHACFEGAELPAGEQITINTCKAGAAGAPLAGPCVRCALGSEPVNGCWYTPGVLCVDDCSNCPTK